METIEKIRVLNGTPKHLSKIGELDSFSYLMINLPFKCNFRCAKCFNLENGKPREYKNKISLEDRLNLIDQAKNLGGKVVVIAGEGEPNLDKETFSLVEYIHNKEMIPIIYSNGSTMTDEFIEFYKKNNTSIVFSFDTLDSRLFAMKTNSKGTLAKVIRNITKTTEAFKEKIKYEDNLIVFNVAVNMTINDHNIMDIPIIKSLWEENAYFICNPLAKFGNAIPNWKDLRDTRIFSDKYIAGTIKKYSESGGPLTLENSGYCGYSRWGIAVSPQGDFMTCAYTNLTDGLLGNIRTKSLREAFKYKHKIENRYYKEKGIAPCLVRMPSFEEYLEKLKKHRN